LHRLAENARNRGVRILREATSGEYYATSGSDPELCYRVTGYSCSCPGFLRWSRCGHHSLLLLTLGWLPEDDPDPTPPIAAARTASIPCTVCNGKGTEHPFGDHLAVVCLTCSGTGSLIAAAELDQAA
jgi:hypothetical protein